MLDERIIRKLQKYRLETRKVRAAVMQGERRSKKRGLSNEFADFRAYVPGDDIRRIDWNIYARHNRPFLRLYEDEQNLEVHVLLDTSISMDWGEGPENKLDFSRKIGGAIAVMALAGGDRFQISAIQGDRIAANSGSLSGRKSTRRALAFLQNQSAAGETMLSAALSAFTVQKRRPGLVILLSDLFSQDGSEEGLRQLDSQGHETVVVHILAKDELEPPWSGELKFEDAETGAIREVTVNPQVVSAYQRRLAAWQAGIRRFCRHRGIQYLATHTHQPWETTITRDLRRMRLVR